MFHVKLGCTDSRSCHTNCVVSIRLSYHVKRDAQARAINAFELRRHCFPRGNFIVVTTRRRFQLLVRSIRPVIWLGSVRRQVYVST